MATLDPITGMASSNHYDPTSGGYVSDSITAKSPVAPTTPSSIMTDQSKGDGTGNPVTVNSSGMATDYLNNKVVPAMNNANNAIAMNNAARAGWNTANYAPTKEAFGVGTNNYVPANSSSTPTSITPADQAVMKVADTPSDGHLWGYSTSDGSRISVPQGTPMPQGYSSTNPNVKSISPVLGQTRDEYGNTITQHQDGTYTKTDLNGVSSQAIPQDFTNAKRISDTLDRIEQVTKGAYPLDPGQQAQLNDLARVYLQKEKEAKDHYDALASGTEGFQNLHGIGGTTGAHQDISLIITKGAQAITDLQTELAGAVAKMQQGFKTDDMNMLKSAYADFTSSSAKLQNQIDSTKAAAAASAKDQRDYLQRVQEHADVEANNLRTFNNLVKEQGIDDRRADMLAKSTMADQALNRQKTSLEIKALQDTGVMNDTIKNLPGGTTLNETTGKPDPVKQKQFLAPIIAKDPILASQIQRAANYTLDPKVFSNKKEARQKFDGMVGMYDSSYSPALYSARFKMENSWGAGGLNSSNAAINTGISHLGELYTAGQALHNVASAGIFSKKYNDVASYIKDNEGKPEVVRYLYAVDTVAPELAKAYKNGINSNAAPGEKEIDSFKQRFTTKMSLDQVGGAAGMATDLLGDKLTSNYRDYEGQMGKSPDEKTFFQPETKAALNSLSKKGVPIDMNKYNFNPNKNVSDADLVGSMNGNNSPSTKPADFFNSLTPTK